MLSNCGSSTKTVKELKPVHEKEGVRLPLNYTKVIPGIEVSILKLNDSDNSKIKNIVLQHSDSIKSKIHYPEIASREGVTGNVIIKFRLNSKGETENIELIKGIGAGCDESVINAISDYSFNTDATIPFNSEYLLIAAFSLSAGYNN